MPFDSMPLSRQKGSQPSTWRWEGGYSGICTLPTGAYGFLLVSKKSTAWSAKYRTQVMNGGTMLIHHQEGLPPLPLEIDDEQLSNSTSHTLASPIPAPTYISGFVTLLRIFLILGECQHRHRILLNDPELGQDLPTLNRWLDIATDRLRRITDRLPAEFRPKEPKTDFGHLTNGSAGIGAIGIGMEDDSDATAGIQQANICITALCVEFALVSALSLHLDSRGTRLNIARPSPSSETGRGFTTGT